MRPRPHGTGRDSAVIDRVLRGGSWNDNARNCRTANRNGNDPDNRNDNIGFRVVVVSAFVDFE